MMLAPSQMSPAGSMVFGASYGADALQEQVGEISDDERKRRMQEAQSRKYSAAGTALASMGALQV
jgi:hypothetical protein